MKISPPQVLIEEADPFKHALFGRKAFADSLTRLLRNVSENLVIFVNAPWGEGKTTFAQMWRAELGRQKLEVTYFDAYAADYFDDPFVCFSGEILGLVDRRLGENRGLLERREFKKTAVEIGKRLAGLAVKVGVRAATLGVIQSTDVKELKEMGTEIASEASKISAEIIEKKIGNYLAEKDSIAAFKESLKKLAAIVREDQGFPLTIVVDELDRCRPDFALSLLERIKHLFDVEGICFVLLVNREHIENYISSVYGDVDGRAYLLKFGNVFVDLPCQQMFPMQYEMGRADYCRILGAHYDIFKQGRDAEFLQRSLEALVEHFALTLREIEKAFTIMAFYYSSLPANQYTNGFLVAMLSALRVKSPSLYGRLRKASVSVDTFFDETGLDHIKTELSSSVNLEWVKDMLRFCLMSDSEFAEAVKKPAEGADVQTRLSQHFGNINLQRNKVIPFFCSRLECFSPGVR